MRDMEWTPWDYNMVWVLLRNDQMQRVGPLAGTPAGRYACQWPRWWMLQMERLRLRARIRNLSDCISKSCSL